MIIWWRETCTGGWAHIRFNLWRQAKLELVWGLLLQIVLGKLIRLDCEPYKIDRYLSLRLLECRLLIDNLLMRILGVRNYCLIHGIDWILLMHKMITNYHLIIDLRSHSSCLIYVLINLLVLVILTLVLVYKHLPIFEFIFVIFYIFINIWL